MMKKIIIVATGLLLAAVMLFCVMPVAADGASTTTPAVNQTTGKGALLVRILRVPTQAQLESLLAKAEANGKITAAQAARIETIWINNHAKFVQVAKSRILWRLLHVKNEANLKTYLDKAVSAKKITPDQEARIIALWEAAHSAT